MPRGKALGARRLRRRARAGSAVCAQCIQPIATGHGQRSPGCGFRHRPMLTVGKPWFEHFFCNRSVGIPVIREWRTHLHPTAQRNARAHRGIHRFHALPHTSSHVQAVLTAGTRLPRTPWYSGRDGRCRAGRPGCLHASCRHCGELVFSTTGRNWGHASIHVGDSIGRFPSRPVARRRHRPGCRHPHGGDLGL